MHDRKETELTFKDYIALVKRRSTLFFGIAAPILTLGVALAFGLPPLYESSGVLLVEQSEVPEYLVRSTVPNFPDERVRTITQRVLTENNLSKIVEQYDLYPELTETMPEEALRLMQERLSVAAEDPALLPNLIGNTENVIAFTVAFSHSTPRVARDVATDLVNLYLSENQRVRQELALETRQFLADQVRRLEREMAETERQIAEFKRQHSGSLPELANMNLQLLDRTERDLEIVESEIRSLRERRALFESELAELSPYAPIVDDAGNVVLSARDRLKMLQRSYVQYSATYSPDHPDLLKIRREIDALSAQTGLPGIDANILQTELAARTAELDAVRERYSEDHPDVQRLSATIQNLSTALTEAPTPRRASAPVAPPDNPVYIQKQVQLGGTAIELDAALARRTDLQERLASLETRITTTPEIEREYSTLTRGYEQLANQYNDVQSKQREAEIAVNLESESKGERFTILSSPRTPTLPEQPNRIAILMLAVAFSLAAGVGAIASAEASDTTVRASRDVQSLLEIPPLVVIPYIDNESDLRSKRWRRLAIATTVCLWVGIATFFVINPAG
jgi:uncharacterized protein involved in exopolysaccharide biosynthesis